MNEQLQAALAKIMEQVASGAFNAAVLPGLYTNFIPTSHGIGYN